MLGIGKNFREIIWKNLDQRQAKIQGTPGVLGDGSGNVAVPGLQNYVYVRIAGGVIQVFNNRVPLVNDLPVVVGYDPLVPGRLQVLSTQADLGIMSQVTTTSFAPSSRYRWMDPQGGEDPLFVEQRQIMPLRLYPAGGLSVAVYPAVVKTPRGYYLVGGNDTYDLAPLLPLSDGVRFVVFYLDDQGQIQYQAGNTVSWNDFDLGKLPQPEGNAVHLIGAVRLYYGQTEIREGRVNTDILDLRLCRKSFVLKGNQSVLETLSVEEGTLAYALDTGSFGVYVGGQWRWMGVVNWADIQNKPSTFPPSAHTHTPDEVGLGNVTNDAQLKRAGNDFTGFTEKTTPADNDLILSEDSAASYAKKRITLGNIYLWLKGRFDSLYAALSHNHDASYYTKTQLNTSGAGGAVHWNNVTNKPSTYPPSTHQHAASDVTSGVFDAARIPNLDASKITSGTLSTDRFSAWQDLIAEGKVLNSNLTIYLSPSGNDTTGNGTQSNPYYSINRAMQDLKQIIANGYTVTIQLANGTYNYNANQTLITVLGAFDYGQCRIIGNTSSPSSVVINFTGGDHGLFANGCLSQWQLIGFTIQGSVGQGLITSFNGSTLWVSSLIFGSSSSRHMIVNLGAKIRTDGNYSITGGATQHFGVFNGGLAEVYMRTITISNNPNFSQAFLVMQSGAGFNSRFTTWSGSATGVRYTLNILCWADTAGYTLPGNQNGTVSNGSVYT